MTPKTETPASSLQCGGLRLTSGFKVYPPRREEEGRSADGWVKGKIEADGVWPYWRIHDKLYDLTSFMEDHPGGKFWLETTRGLDITESFESSHFGRRPYAILKKHYVGEASTPRNSPFTFKDNGFYMTLKRKVIPILLKKGKGPTWESFMILDGLLVASLTLMILGGWHSSTLLMILAGLTLGMSIITTHNFTHQKDNWRVYILDALFILTSREWRITHALSHHTFTNTIYDIDIAFEEPYMYFYPAPHTPKRAGYIAFVTMLKKIFGFPFMTVATIFKQRDHWTWLVPTAHIFLLGMASQSLARGVFYWCIMNWTAAAYCNLIGLTVSHHHPDVYSEGDRLPEDKDWGLLQLFATRDRVFVMDCNFFSAIAFGNHILHHLFPTVDMFKLPLLLDPMIETCKEFGIEYKVLPFWELFKGTYLSILCSKPNEKLPKVIKNNRLIK